jgi:hypothetical protein
VNLGSDRSQSRERGYEAAASDGPAMRVIVTGDDFGRSRAINHAILTAHREGILTSASLMVAAPHADEAVILARQNPSLAVGLHLTLSGGLWSTGAAGSGPLPDGPACSISSIGARTESWRGRYPPSSGFSSVPACDSRTWTDITTCTSTPPSSPYWYHWPTATAPGVSAW